MDCRETTYTDSEAVDQPARDEALHLAFRNAHPLCLHPPTLPILSFWGIPTSSGQFKMRPRTLKTRPKKNTIMWENVEVIITYSCWEMGFYLLNIEERRTMFKKEKNSIFAHRIPPISFYLQNREEGSFCVLICHQKMGARQEQWVYQVSSPERMLGPQKLKSSELSLQRFAKSKCKSLNISFISGLFFQLVPSTPHCKLYIGRSSIQTNLNLKTLFGKKSRWNRTCNSWVPWNHKIWDPEETLIKFQFDLLIL